MLGDGEAQGVLLRVEHPLADDVAGAHEATQVQDLGGGEPRVADLVGDRPCRLGKAHLDGVGVQDDELAGVAEPVEVPEAGVPVAA